MHRILYVNPTILCLFLLLTGQLQLVLVEAKADTPQIERNLIGNEKASLNFNDLSDETNHRQNFCDNYERMIDNSTTLTLSQALSGEHINAIFATNTRGLFNYDEETGLDPNFPGLFPKIMDEIAERANFTWRTTGFGFINKTNSSITSTEMLVWGAENYDIFVGEWDVTATRMNLELSFTSEVFDTDVIMVRNVIVTESKDQIFWGNWLYPFEGSVWIMVLVTIILSCFTFQFLEFIGKVRVTDQRSLWKWTLDNFYMCLINFTQNFAHEPTTYAGQVFSVSFAFWAMLIGATYTANLASLLVQEAGSLEFTLNRIQDAIDLKMYICINPKESIMEYMENTHPQALPLFVFKENIEEMYNSLNKGECDLLIGYENEFTIMKMEEEFNPDCHLTWEGRAINEYSQAFVTKMDPGNKCSLLVQKVMNYYILEIDNDGTLDDLKDDFILNLDTRLNSCDAIESVSRRLKSSNSKNNSNNRRLGYANSNDSGPKDGPKDTESSFPDEALTLTQMAGTFLLHLILSLLSIMIGIIDRLKKSKHNVKGKNEETNQGGHQKQEDELSKQKSSGTSSSLIETQIQELQSVQNQMLSTQNEMLLMLKNIQDKQ